MKTMKGTIKALEKEIKQLNEHIKKLDSIIKEKPKKMKVEKHDGREELLARIKKWRTEI